jgi:hypothetical protein
MCNVRFLGFDGRVSYMTADVKYVLPGALCMID